MPWKESARAHGPGDPVRERGQRGEAQGAGYGPQPEAREAEVPGALGVREPRGERLPRRRGGVGREAEADVVRQPGGRALLLVVLPVLELPARAEVREQGGDTLRAPLHEPGHGVPPGEGVRGHGEVLLQSHEAPEGAGQRRERVPPEIEPHEPA